MSLDLSLDKHSFSPFGEIAANILPLVGMDLNNNRLEKELGNTKIGNTKKVNTKRQKQTDRQIKRGKD